MQATTQTVRPITPMNPLPAAVHMNGDATTASVFQTTNDATDIPTAIMEKMKTTVMVRGYWCSIILPEGLKCIYQTFMKKHGSSSSLGLY